MSILVTGHRGFIGSNFVSYVKKNTDWAVGGWEWGEDLPDISKYRWVIHLGGISSTTERDLDKLMEHNLEFSQWLYNECVRHGTNLQYSSSASVYGTSWDFSEDSPKDPQSPYAWTKYLFDRWVEQQDNDITVQGFRYFNVYGENEKHKGDMASPVTKFTLQAQNDDSIKLFYGSTRYKRDFVYVGDCVRAQIEFIKRVNENGIWNIGTGKPYSFADIAAAIAFRYNRSVEQIPMPTDLKDQYQEYTCADLTKFNEAIPDFEWTNVLDWISNNNPCTN